MERTQGTETSKYLEENKENSILLVVANEKGIAQTAPFGERGCRTDNNGTRTSSRSALERRARVGDSPVGERRGGPVGT